MYEDLGITWTAVRNPKWADSNRNLIFMEVNFNHLSDEWVPFGAVESGDHPHSHALYAAAVAGEFGPIADPDPEPVEE